MPSTTRQPSNHSLSRALMQPLSHIFAHRGHDLMSGVVTSHFNIAGACLKTRGIFAHTRRRIKLITLAREMKHGGISLLVQLACFPIAGQPAADADDAV